MIPETEKCRQELTPDKFQRWKRTKEGDKDNHMQKGRMLLSCANMTREGYDMNRLTGKGKITDEGVKCKGASPVQ